MSAIFSCREASRLISLARDRPLVLGERAALRLHRLMCGACRCYDAQLRLIDEAFRRRAAAGHPDLPVSEGLDAAARERIRARMRRSW